MNRESIENDRIFAIRNFLPEEECQRHVQLSEAIGYETFSIGGEVFHGYRDNARVIVDDQELADSLWKIAEEFVPPVTDSLPASGLNPRFRYYRYTGTEAFARHLDGTVRIGKLQSKLTFMVYLADVSKGGETRFFDDDMKIAHSVKPELGKALVFEHAILHEGVAVEDGIKYVLRTDVLYG